MIESDKQLLIELDYGVISTETFLKLFSVDIKKDSDFVTNELHAAIATSDAEEIQIILPLIWLSGDTSKYIGILNELLINPNHRSHQQVARALQDIPSPTTIPFIKQALESNFDYLEYTFSESDVIAKWFSWLLYSIGTNEAIDLMKEYSTSKDEGIKNEMLYRLKKVKA